MKREKVVIPRSFWYLRISLLLLIIHVMMYSFLWIVALGLVGNLAKFEMPLLSVYQNQILIALFWLPFLLIHVGAHLYFAGRSSGGVSERLAYREGFHDGAQHSIDNGYDPSRLTLDEDGELVEIALGEKRKRDQR